jgi:hypothetical protein
VGYYVNHVEKMIMGDALSRIANAYYVLYIEPPHLASLGFVWNPLPSVLEVPFMFLAQVYRPIATSALAGMIVTAVATAGTAVLIYRTCRYFKMGLWSSLLLTALYCINPFIFIYGFNGMSEAVFIFTVMLIVTQFICWMEDGQRIHLLIMGIGMALAFLSRYEAIPLCAAIFIGVAIIVFRRRKSNLRSAYYDLESTCVLIFTPVVTAIALWLLSNKVIMGDALYFLHSNYSNTAQSINIQSPELLKLVGHPLSTLWYEIKRLLIFAEVFFFILALRLWQKRFFTTETLILALLVIAIPVLHYVMLFKGTSFGWLRFYSYIFPIALAWLPYELSKLEFKKPSFKPLGAGLGLAAIACTALVTGVVMANPQLAPEENTTYRQKNVNFEQQLQIAEYINANYPNDKLLLDNFMNYETVLNLDNTERIITTCSYEFQEAVASPALYGIKYLLAIKNEGVGNLDAINMAYPDLYEYGASWCTLIKDFGGYKLYRINDQ